MGLAIRDIVVTHEVSFDDLNQKTLAADAFNMLYQFLTTIRGADGSPLTDNRGNITSHLVGLFSRSTNLMQKDLRLCFVFDGETPKLKEKERERRKELKVEAQKRFEEAKSKEDLEEMKKFAGRTARLTPEMVDEAKKLLEALGLPTVQAPSEGEAQAAYMTKNGDCFAAVSQDFDSLLHGSPKLVRNLSLVGKKKIAGKLSYATIKPEMLTLSENLNHLGIDQDQLIALAMLVGTDYNVGGIKGIGPKKAITLVKQHGKDFNTLFTETNWNDHFSYSWKEVFDLIKRIPVTDDYKLTWRAPDSEKVKELLVEQHDFSLERVEKLMEKLSTETTHQRGLAEFF